MSHSKIILITCSLAFFSNIGIARDSIKPIDSPEPTLPNWEETAALFGPTGLTEDPNPVFRGLTQEQIGVPFVKYQFVLQELTWRAIVDRKKVDPGNAITFEEIDQTTKYRWRVRFLAETSTSCSLPPCTEWSPFSPWTEFYFSDLPPKPSKIVTLEHSELLQTGAHFEWQDSGGAVEYQVLVRDLTEQELVESVRVQENTYTLPDTLDTAHKYNWKVRARGAAGWGEFSDPSVFNFSDFPASPPNTPVAVYPIGEKETWDQEQFQVQQLEDVSETLFVIQDFSTGEVVLRERVDQHGPLELADYTLPRYTKLRWRARSKNGAGWGDFSTWQSFSWGAPPDALEPPLVDLRNTTEGTISWYGLPTATEYLIVVRDRTNSEIVLRQSTLSTSFQHQFLPANRAELEWRVRARNAGGWGAFGAWNPVVKPEVSVSIDEGYLADQYGDTINIKGSFEGPRNVGLSVLAKGGATFLACKNNGEFYLNNIPIDVLLGGEIQVVVSDYRGRLAIDSANPNDSGVKGPILRVNNFCGNPPLKSNFFLENAPSKIIGVDVSGDGLTDLEPSGRDFSHTFTNIGVHRVVAHLADGSSHAVNVVVTDNNQVNAEAQYLLDRIQRSLVNRDPVEMKSLISQSPSSEQMRSFMENNVHRFDSFAGSMANAEKVFSSYSMHRYLIAQERLGRNQVSIMEFARDANGVMRVRSF